MSELGVAMPLIQGGIKRISLEVGRAAFGAEEQSASACPGAQQQKDAAAAAAAISVGEASVGAGSLKKAGVLGGAGCFTAGAASRWDDHRAFGALVGVRGWVIGEFSAAFAALCHHFVGHGGLPFGGLRIGCESHMLLHYSTSVLRLQVRAVPLRKWFSMIEYRGR